MDSIIKNMCDNYNDNFDIKKELRDVTPLELVKAVPDLITALRAERKTVAEWESVSQRQSIELEEERQKNAKLQQSMDITDEANIALHSALEAEWEKITELEPIMKTQIEYIKMLENENTELHNEIIYNLTKAIK